MATLTAVFSFCNPSRGPVSICGWPRSWLTSRGSLDFSELGAPGRAGPHHDRDLGNAERRHLRLVVEDAAEVAFSGKISSCIGRNAPPESTM